MLFALSSDGNTSSAGSSTTERVNAAVGRSTAGSARLGVAPMRANGDYGAAVTLLSARTAAAAPVKRDLSKAFSVDAVGNDGCLELRCDDGSIAELLYQLVTRVMH